MAVTPGTRIGAYEILAKLGEGGMGEVYRARDLALERDVAVKLLPESLAGDAERLARFEREAKTLAGINHPHIAHVHGFETVATADGGTRALVMELVEGDDLAQILSRGRLPLDDALPIARQIAEALEAAHAQGIVHRDLKPANIKVRPDGSVKVLDFGLAKAIEQGTGAGDRGSAERANSPTLTTPAMTRAGMILGTAAYMAPEQAKGRAVDRRADLWSFGCVLYEMLTGAQAFDGEDVTDILGAIVRGEPDWTRLPANVSAGIRTLLKRCLKKDPRDRLDSAAAARLEIVDAAAASGDAPAAASRPGGRGAMIGWFVAAAASILAAVVSWNASRLAPAESHPRRITFQVAYPPGFIPPAGGRPFLSPDGRQLVVTGRDSQGVSIWLYDLASGAWRRTGASAGTNAVAWSPDSRSLAFLGTGTSSLRVIDVATGASRDVAKIDKLAVANTGTLAWGDGVIVFSLGRASPLFQVPAAGGAVTPLTSINQSRGDVSHFRPRFLADGRRLSYLVANPMKIPTSSARFATLDPRGAVPQLELTGAHLVVDESHSIFVGGNSLLEQTYNQTSGLVGEPSVIARDITSQLQGPMADATSDVLVYRWVEPVEQRQFGWYDRSGTLERVIDVPADARNPQLSRDGQTMAFEVFQGDTALRNILAVGFRDNQRLRVAVEDLDDADPQWSSDGRRVLFGRANAASTGQFIMKSFADGRERVVGTRDNPQQWLLAWSPDESHLLYSDQGTACISMALAGTTEKPIRYEQADKCRFSPDGQFVAYVDLTSSEIQVEPYPPTGVRWQVSTNGGAEPRWHPNGHELFFLAPDQTLTAVDVALKPPFKAGTPRPLFRARIPSPMRTGVACNYDVAPDGRFVINTVKPGTDLASLRVILNWRP